MQGPSVPSETRSAARRSVQPFISDSPMSTHNEEVSSQAAGSVELTERLRAKSNQKSTSKKPLASQRRPSRGRKRLSEDDQAEVKVEFVPPQSYGPESPGSLVSTQSKADESDLSLTNQEILDTLPSGNTAFSDLVAKFTRFSDLPKGPPLLLLFFTFFTTNCKSFFDVSSPRRCHLLIVSIRSTNLLAPPWHDEPMCQGSTQGLAASTEAAEKLFPET